ncbi:flagellar basal-body rod protein FlgB [Aliiroseovarius sediminilitoris]|uniref:Flagellar basal body rod protein FlgB n=1 Tax=Aliiroseovarius sediminilitoris TaxID=1173584 RepID=A0A1I0MWM2_9RHOB|nr:FlgB family protein [Aliiroseovarius sediminilitoris]SEV92830.1 flagellar basal-body rod protein FlgB [Aliiroseovarius sediminilitoris]
MFEKMEILTKAVGLAKHAAARQSVITQNIANADTPGYRAKDIASFAETFRENNGGAMQATRARHLTGSVDQANAEPNMVYRAGAMSPNGNSVALETEMMAAAEAKRDQDLALTVYKTSLGIMRTALGRR